MGSIGIRVPLDNLTANSYDNIVNTPTSTATGNLTIFAKYILAERQDRQPDLGVLGDHTADRDRAVRGRPLSPPPQCHLLSDLHWLYLQHNNGTSRGLAGSASRRIPTTSR